MIERSNGCLSLCVGWLGGNGISSVWLPETRFLKILYDIMILKHKSQISARLLMVISLPVCVGLGGNGISSVWLPKTRFLKILYDIMISKPNFVLLESPRDLDRHGPESSTIFSRSNWMKCGSKETVLYISLSTYCKKSFWQLLDTQMPIGQQDVVVQLLGSLVCQLEIKTRLTKGNVKTVINNFFKVFVVHYKQRYWSRRWKITLVLPQLLMIERSIRCSSLWY